jgi:hypothetical protein
MGRLSLAWQILTNAAVAARVQQFLKAPTAIPGPPTATVAAPSVQAPIPAPPTAPATLPKPVRSDALSLLASLQREGRLIDFLREPIANYSDSQIGAAVRDIHRDCSAVLERQFGLRPVLEQPEGSTVSLQGITAGRLRMAGPGSGQNAASGTLVHPGWMATRCDVPVWTGDARDSMVVAPAEVEVR